MAPTYNPPNGTNGPRRMVLGRGRNDYLVTVLYETDEGVKALLLVEVYADTINDAISTVQALSTGEIITCVKVNVEL